MLRALEAQWNRMPPVQYLVAAYLQYQPAAGAVDADTQTDGAQGTGGQPDPQWLNGMGGQIPAPAGLAAAATNEDAMAALERLFFGDVSNGLGQRL